MKRNAHGKASLASINKIPPMPKSDTQVDRLEKLTQQGEHQLALLARNNT